MFYFNIMFQILPTVVKHSSMPKGRKPNNNFSYVPEACKQWIPFLPLS